MSACQLTLSVLHAVRVISFVFYYSLVHNVCGILIRYFHCISICLYNFPHFDIWPHYHYCLTLPLPLTLLLGVYAISYRFCTSYDIVGSYDTVCFRHILNLLSIFLQFHTCCVWHSEWDIHVYVSMYMYLFISTYIYVSYNNNNIVIIVLESWRMFSHISLGYSFDIQAYLSAHVSYQSFSYGGWHCHLLDCALYHGVIYWRPSIYICVALLKNAPQLSPHITNWFLYNSFWSVLSHICRILPLYYSTY